LTHMSVVLASSS